MRISPAQRLWRDTSFETKVSLQLACGCREFIQQYAIRLSLSLDSHSDRLCYTSKGGILLPEFSATTALVRLKSSE